MSRDSTHEGGCACGAVRYRAQGPGFRAGFCHCGSCRHACGAPYVGWVSFSRASFVFNAHHTASVPRCTRSSAIWSAA